MTPGGKGAFTNNPEFASFAGKLGGNATKKKHEGDSFYSDIGKKGGANLRDKKPAGYFKTLGSEGGKKRAEKYRLLREKAAQMIPEAYQE